MKLLHRYIFSSVATATLSGMALFTFVLVTANAMRDVLERLASGQLDAITAFRMMALLLPFTLSYAAPMGLLVAILLVLGRMSARNEIVALKSAGVSIWRISSPILLIAMLGSGLCMYVNNVYAPIARTQYRQMLSGIVHEEPLRFIVPGRFVRDFPGYVIYVGEREGERLGNVWLWVLGPDRELRQFLRAKEGTISYDLDKNSLILSVYQATGQFRSAAGVEDLGQVSVEAEFAHTSFAMSLDKLLPARRAEAQPAKLSNMSLEQLLEARATAARRMAEAADAAEGNAALVEHTRTGYYISRNFAFAYSVLSLAMLGIPLGIRVGRQETYANMALALALSMAYFLLVFMAGWAERTPSAYPQLLVWGPNILFMGLALLLMRRSNKH